MPNYSEEVLRFLDPFTIDHLDDRTMPKLNDERDSDGYFITEQIGHAFIVDGPPVFYKINHHGFRSKHFEKFNNDKETILFSGCSWTFGEGLPVEYTWTELLVNKLEQDGKQVDHYNIGYMGQSINHIVKNIYSFIRNYGKPKYLLICLPDLQRNIYYSQKFNKYIKAYVNTSFIGSKDKDRERYTKNYQEEDNLLVAINSMLYLEDFCKASEINLIWTTWANQDYNTYKNIGFKNLMDPDTSFIAANPSYRKLEFPYYPNRMNLPYWEEARDGAHPGTCWTNFIASRFYKTIIGEEL